MKAKCIKAVSDVLGRQLTKAEADAITGQIMQALRNLSRRDPAGFAAKSQSQRLQEAAVEASNAVLADAKLKQTRVALQVQAHQRIQSFIDDRVAEGMSQLDALDRLIAFDADMRSKTVSIESAAEANSAIMQSQMLDALTQVKATWFGLGDNPQAARDLIMEIRGQSSRNPKAKAGAKVWKETTEAARLRFNRAGGDIGKLDDWGMPQHHSQRLVARAGKDKWVADTAPLLDRNNYFNPDGTRMTDAQFDAFLREAYDTIATGGANKLVPGQFKGSGARANRGSTSRQIHFRDAESYIKYQESYGDRTLPEILVSHIDGIAKDIALVESFGPNPDTTFRYFRDKAVREAKLAKPTETGKVDSQAVKVENLYNVVTGKTLPVANERIATAFDTLRNWLVASRLGSAVITSLSDEGTLRLVARTNNLPQLRLLKNQLATLNIANKVEERLANRAGLGLRAMIGTLNRFGTDNLVGGKSRKLANFVIRAQGLTAITEARRRAFSVTMMDAIGSVVRDHGKLADLDPVDNATLLSKGVTEADYAVWKAAKAEDWGHGNANMLTAESIYRTPDSAIDPVIAPRVKELRDEAQSQLDELNQRDTQDQQWIAARQQKLRDWVSAHQAKLTKRIEGAQGEAKSKLRDLQRDLAALNDRIDTARSFFDTAKRGPLDMTGLRESGVSEGRYRERIREQAARLRKISRDAKSVRSDLDQGFQDRFARLQEELNARVESGRLDDDAVAYLFEKFDNTFTEANARLTERIGKSEAGEAAKTTQVQAKIQAMQTEVAGFKSQWDAARKAIGTLRDQSVREGRSIEASKNLRAEVREVNRKVESLRKELTDDFVQKWGERQADFMEFATRAGDRAKRRQQVADRINRDIAPKIEAERMKAREQAATKLLGIILEESDMAVIQPGARERALMGANTQSGTLKGELTRSFFQFKAFPIAMITRHWRRGLSGNAGNRAAYLSSLIATTALLGVMSMQVNEVLNGRDPRNLNVTEKGGVRGWIAGILKGGSMGLYGDFLFGTESRFGQTPIAAALGPTVGLAESALQLSQQNMVQMLQGKDTDFGAEGTRFVRSNTPGANLWYAKGALDHMIFHQLQEYFSPGYLRKVQSRARREYGQQYWWEPGELTPDRAPDLGAVAGQ